MLTSETYEQTLARFIADFKRLTGGKEIDVEMMFYVERDARAAFELQDLPAIQPRIDSHGNEQYYCPQCKRRLSLNYATRTIDGYSSLNCITHGWVGKWKHG